MWEYIVCVVGFRPFVGLCPVFIKRSCKMKISKIRVVVGVLSLASLLGASNKGEGVVSPQEKAGVELAKKASKGDVNDTYNYVLDLGDQGKDVLLKAYKNSLEMRQKGDEIEKILALLGLRTLKETVEKLYGKNDQLLKDFEKEDKEVVLSAKVVTEKPKVPEIAKEVKPAVVMPSKEIFAPKVEIKKPAVPEVFQEIKIEKDVKPVVVLSIQERNARVMNLVSAVKTAVKNSYERLDQRRRVVFTALSEIRDRYADDKGDYNEAFKEIVDEIAEAYYLLQNEAERDFLTKTALFHFGGNKEFRKKLKYVFDVFNGHIAIEPEKVSKKPDVIPQVPPTKVAEDSINFETYLESAALTPSNQDPVAAVIGIIAEKQEQIGVDDVKKTFSRLYQKHLDEGNDVIVNVLKEAAAISFEKDIQLLGDLKKMKKQEKNVISASVTKWWNDEQPKPGDACNHYAASIPANGPDLTNAVEVGAAINFLKFVYDNATGISGAPAASRAVAIYNAATCDKTGMDDPNGW